MNASCQPCLRFWFAQWQGIKLHNFVFVLILWKISPRLNIAGLTTEEVSLWCKMNKSFNTFIATLSDCTTDSPERFWKYPSTRDVHWKVKTWICNLSKVLFILSSQSIPLLQVQTFEAAPCRPEMLLSCRFILVYGSDTGKPLIRGQPWCKTFHQQRVSLREGTEQNVKWSKVKQVRRLWWSVNVLLQEVVVKRLGSTDRYAVKRYFDSC